MEAWRRIILAHAAPTTFAFIYFTAACLLATNGIPIDRLMELSIILLLLLPLLFLLLIASPASAPTQNRTTASADTE